MTEVYDKQFIGGEWVPSTNKDLIDVINPATEGVFAQVASGTKEDINKAVAAAKTAFPHFSKTTVEERISLLDRIIAAYEARKDDIASAVTKELGSTSFLSEQVHFNAGLSHFIEAKKVLQDFQFEERDGHLTIRKEAIGVCGFITPWNFPTNQACIKIAGALAAGCTIVLKPSELTPVTAVILGEIFEAADVPAGVINIVNGYGDPVGEAMSNHSDIDLISFTGSNETGKRIMKNAADTVKKVALELGGKSPMIILDDYDMKEAAKIALSNVTFNCGQVCTLASRTFVPSHKKEEFIQALDEIYDEYLVGMPEDASSRIGPVISQNQFDRVQYYIEKGIEEGATVHLGGSGKPNHLSTGYFVQPTVFTNVKNDMTIAQEEIFGPVMSILTYDTVEEAIEMANDTIYGLAAYVVGKDEEQTRQVANELRAGEIRINKADIDNGAPFGGFKQSGIGRERGRYGVEEFLEIKTILV